jgi:hypothetical protein
MYTISDPDTITWMTAPRVNVFFLPIAIYSFPIIEEHPTLVRKVIIGNMAIAIGVD